MVAIRRTCMEPLNPTQRLIIIKVLDMTVSHLEKVKETDIKMAESSLACVIV